LKNWQKWLSDSHKHEKSLKSIVYLNIHVIFARSSQHFGGFIVHAT
jgi:hypothetical protein